MTLPDVIPFHIIFPPFFVLDIRLAKYWKEICTCVYVSV